MSKEFDVIIIGGGPGGYAAAIRCAQRGAQAALVEKGEIGGTCLNRGCIPSKALLGSAHFITLARSAHLMGLEIGSLKPNWQKIQSRKDAIVAGFAGGVEGLLKSNKVQVFAGRGIVTDSGSVRVDSQGTSQSIKAKNIIIATGSIPIEIPALRFDGGTILSSDDVLSLKAVPGSMMIVGGGVIGCEMACVYATMGCKVTIVEAMPTLLPNEDEWVGTAMAKEFRKLSINTFTGKKVLGVDRAGNNCKVNVEGEQAIDCEKVLVAVGRKAICDSETIQNLGLKMDGARISVNKKMQTNVPCVYAVGDAVGSTYLAHGAFMEAHVAAVNATGGDRSVDDYSLVPRAVYTFPEAASVGLSMKKCTEMGIEAKVGIAPFKYNGRSVAHNETMGEVRVIKNTKTQKVIGVTIVGSNATEMIAAASLLIGTTKDAADIIFPHPTVSETLKEALEDAFGISLHVPPR